jgi:hypothetical protein
MNPSAEKNSTIILPLPTDLLTAFLQNKEKELPKPYSKENLLGGYHSF